MKRILSSLVALSCLFLSSKAFSQNPTTGNFTGGSACDLVVEDFATDPTARGFAYSGFAYSGTQTSGQNLSIAAANPNTDYIITSAPYYLSSGGTVRVGFTIATSTGSSNNYFVNSNNFSLITQVLSSDEQTVLASYTNTVSAANTYCVQVVDADLTAGSLVKYRFIFTSSAGVSGTRIITLDNFTSSSNQQSPLPVTFMSFTAAKTALTNALTWKIAGELNVARYDVERSGNGKTYSVIGSVPAILLTSYSFTDALPLTGSNYYRIKAVDKDAKYKYSPVVQIKSSTKTTTLLRTYPTLATGTITIEHDAYSSGTGLQITSVDGRLVKTILPAQGTQQTQVSVSGFSKGLYIVRYQNSLGETESAKFIKE